MPTCKALAIWLKYFSIEALEILQIIFGTDVTFYEGMAGKCYSPPKSPELTKESRVNRACRWCVPPSGESEDTIA